MGEGDQNRKMLVDLNRIKFINDALANLNLRKKEISDEIVKLSKSGKPFGEEDINRYLGELSNIESQKFYLESEKNSIMNEIRKTLEARNMPIGASVDICNINGILTVSGIPGIGKTEYMLRIMNSCSARDKVIIILRDKERIEQLLKNYDFSYQLYFINPVYTEKRLDTKNLDQVTKIANRISSEIKKILISKKDPIVFVHRSNDISLDRIDEISNILKEHFWSSFIEGISMKEKKVLLILNCDDTNDECTNLLSFSDYFMTIRNDDGKTNVYFTNTRL